MLVTHAFPDRAGDGVGVGMATASERGVAGERGGWRSKEIPKAGGGAETEKGPGRPSNLRMKAA